MKKIALFCLLIISAIAAPRAQGTSLKMDGYPDPGSASVVKLLSNGAAPRRALRLVVPANYTQHVDMTMEMSVSMQMAGLSLPPMTVPTVTVGCDIVVTGVAPNGDISFTAAMTTAPITAASDPTIAAAMKDLDPLLKAMRLTMTMTSRGITLPSNAGRVEPSAGGVSAPILSQLSNQVEGLSTPLPEEEVGVGARWEVRQATSNSGMQAYQRVEYEVLSMDASSAALKMRVDQTAPPQPVTNSALPPKTDVRLTKLVGIGSGTATQRLDALAATSTLNLQTTTAMDISLGGAMQPMGSTQTIKVTTTAKK